mmetsp:Transcript_24316/g.76754  ORF Transcript_24316/g.76754 Transcript_24316/m.76754 type:complete len:269 (+) Transcript_24316:83-889(+)
MGACCVQEIPDSRLNDGRPVVPPRQALPRDDAQSPAPPEIGRRGGVHLRHPEQPPAGNHHRSAGRQRVQVQKKQVTSPAIREEFREGSALKRLEEDGLAGGAVEQGVEGAVVTDFVGRSPQLRHETEERQGALPLAAPPAGADGRVAAGCVGHEAPAGHGAEERERQLPLIALLAGAHGSVAADNVRRDLRGGHVVEEQREGTLPLRALLAGADRGVARHGVRRHPPLAHVQQEGQRRAPLQAFAASADRGAAEWYVRPNAILPRLLQ